MKLVIDSSVAMKWFVAEPRHDIAKAILDSEADLVAPELVMAEMTNALWRKVRIGEITADQAHAAIDEMPGYVSLERHTRELAHMAFDVAEMLEHSVYDCMFLACALQSGDDAALVTDDEKFAGKAIRAGFGERLRQLDAGPALSDDNPTEVPR